MDIKKRRTELNLTMKEIAEYVGVSEATVSRWESGNIANMKRSRIQLLAEVLRISPLDIIGMPKNESGELSCSEEIAVELLRELNAEGQEVALNVLRGLVAGGQYKKDNQTAMVEGA